jgi:hypothetical protein
MRVRSLASVLGMFIAMSLGCFKAGSEDDVGDDATETGGEPVCGNAIVEDGEACDDGNDDDTDDCPTSCEPAVCGDGFEHADVEECDDGNDVPDDACPNDCIALCGGVVFDPGNGIEGCWYTAAAVGMTCTQVCMDHGGFDSAASQHTGNAAGVMFWPNKGNGGDWVTVECSSTDNNINWGANGQAPDANFSHPACYLNCACTT